MRIPGMIQSTAWAVGLSLAGCLSLVGQQSPEVSDTVPAVDAGQHRETVAAAIRFLESRQAQDGSFSAQLGPAVTAMCATSMLQNGVPANRPSVQKAIEYVKSFVRPDGGVYAPNSHLRNYETSVAVMMFA